MTKLQSIGAIVCVWAGVAILYQQLWIDRSTLTPASELMSQEHSLAFLWGTYRPGLYFGMRSRTFPTHISTGLMWTVLEDQASTVQLRHECRQEDKLQQYGWLKHTGRRFGHQRILDQHFNTRLDTYYIRKDSEQVSWTARVDVQHLSKERASDSDQIDLFFYVDVGCADDSLDNPCRKDTLHPLTVHEKEGNVYITGIFPSGMPFQMKIQATDGEIRYFGRQESNIMTVQHDVAKELRRSGGQLIDNSMDPNSTLIVVQARLQLSQAVLDISFNEADFMTDQAIQAEIQDYDDQFEKSFGLAEKSFNSSMIEFAQAALSNLVGGIGYFYGASKLSNGNVAPIAPLYTAVPSRSFFPRGFLWDEGFHQTLLALWDKEISKDVIAHWLDRMDADGWIAREQILGVEAEARVPDEFIQQHVDNANPPTLLLALDQILSTEMTLSDIEYLKSIFPRLKLWYEWFKKSQKGEIKGTFRWRGRNPNDGKMISNTLASGLDDYPRASEPNDNEIHVDLLCWMIKFSDQMNRFGSLLNSSNAEFVADKALWMKTLDEHHYNSKSKMYFDAGKHSENGEIQSHVVIRCASSDRQKSIDATSPLELLQRRISSCPEDFPVFLYPLGDGQGGLLTKPVFVPKTIKYQHVRHVGYVSCFPFFLKLLPADSKSLGAIIEHLTDPEQMWTPYGIRSMSAKSKFYQVGNAPGDQPYWRGPIWMNMNYLATVAFHHYSRLPGPYQEKCRSAYKQLRENLISNVYREYRRTGYLWEQYNEETGSGQRCHPFTGWTALVVNIMSEKF